MTVGQRIAHKRKGLGLSQEGLGEQIGVSRQAIYKWESDATLPEIEKLIALSKIFGVSIGWLLGVEETVAESDTPEPATQESGELTQAQLDMVEEIVRRYQEAQPSPPKRRKWPWVLVALVLVIVFVKLFSTLNELRNDFNRIENSVQYIDRNVDNQISSITNRVENILNRMNNFTVEHSAEILRADLVANTVTFELNATPKTYTEGMTALFQAEYGDGVAEIEAILGENQNYTANLTCPLTDEIVISAVFVTGDKRETQKIQTYYSLYRESFPYEYMSGPPLFFEMNGDVLPEGSYYELHTGDSVYEGQLPRAKAVGQRLGLFRNKSLVHWYEQQEEKPAGYQGDWPDHLFFRNPTEYTLDHEGEYCLALVVEDEYGREIVYSEHPIVFEEDESGGDWTYTDGYALPGANDPANWEY